MTPAPLMQTAAVNTMRQLAMLFMGPALWAWVAAMLAYTGHGAIRMLRRG